ncbi:MULTISPECIES: oligosaccharide flippase family protein [unclassified Vibrio]|uniref:Oligosaccharide flippase family protein n=1 Tax=Vibrio sp. HB236076 TaxID=3232307 RepID=A0AB39HBR5_9VIBR|nr:oligosaccharide flippase family protein [Vibrio sp. HB161653]MDP5255801.1 oligosaccharide flippase family protein [Vibrio sp. HB161653]
MLNQHPFLRTVFSTGALQGFSRLLALLMGVAMARLLGPENFGAYGFVVSAMAIALILPSAGIHELTVREVARCIAMEDNDRLVQYLRWSSLYTLVFGAVAIVLFAWYLSITPFEVLSVSSIFLACVLLFLRALLIRQGGLLTGLKRPAMAVFSTLTMIPLCAIVMIAGFTWADIQWHLSWMLAIQVASVTIGFGLAYRVTRQFFKPRAFVSSSVFFSRWWTILLPLALVKVVLTLNAELASVILGTMEGTVSVGYFKVAFQAAALLALGQVTMDRIIAPKISSAFARADMARVNGLFIRAALLNLLVAIPTGIGLVLVGQWLVVNLFGMEYLAAYPLIIVLVLGQLGSVFMGPCDSVLCMTGNERFYLFSLLIGLVVLVLSLYFLIPVYHEMGAAIAVALTGVSISIVSWYCVRSKIGLEFWLWRVLRGRF